MNLPKIKKAGTTTTRKKFFDQLCDAINASQKHAGRHVSVSEYPGKGTVINVADSSTRRGGGGVIPPGEGACCNPDTGLCSITTPAGCSGHFLGIGTTCAGVDCTRGACCHPDGSCTVTTPGSCFGTFQGEGTTCTPNPCPMPPCNGCGFAAFDGSGRMFLTQTIALSGYSDVSASCTSTVDAARADAFNSSCVQSCSCSGSVNRTFEPVCSCSPSTCSTAPEFDPRDPTTWTTNNGAPNIIGCVCDSGCGSCCAFHLSLSSDSAAVRTFNVVASSGCDSASGTITVTLSNECTPP